MSFSAKNNETKHIEGEELIIHVKVSATMARSILNEIGTLLKKESLRNTMLAF